MAMQNKTLTVGAVVAGALLLAPSRGGAAQSSGAKKPLTVGFSQIGAESGWRTAETKSIRYEAAKRGVNLKFSDAQQKQENQIKALGTFIAQRVDAIILARVVEPGWELLLNQVQAVKISMVC